MPDFDVQDSVPEPSDPGQRSQLAACDFFPRAFQLDALQCFRLKHLGTEFIHHFVNRPGTRTAGDDLRTRDLFTVPGTQHIPAQFPVFHLFILAAIQHDESPLPASAGADAEEGDSLAQLVVGHLYYMGEYVTRNYRLAREWFYLSALQGNAVAQMNLAYMYAHGYGTEVNEPEAAKWRQKAETNQGEDMQEYGNLILTDE